VRWTDNPQSEAVVRTLASNFLSVKDAILDVWPIEDGSEFRIVVYRQPFKKGDTSGRAVVTTEELMAARGDEYRIIEIVKQAVRAAERRLLGPEIRSFRFQKRNPKHLRKDKDNALQE
jgi:hypothetical protein